MGLLFMSSALTLTTCLISWFTRLYDSAKRGLAVPRHGFNPLSEESFHKILGTPQGDIEVQYFIDYELEVELVPKLFPIDGSRPKVTIVAKPISECTSSTAVISKIYGCCTLCQPYWLLQLIRRSVVNSIQR